MAAGIGLSLCKLCLVANPLESMKSTWYFCLLSVEMGDRNKIFLTCGFCELKFLILLFHLCTIVILVTVKTLFSREPTCTANTIIFPLRFFFLNALRVEMLLFSFVSRITIVKGIMDFNLYIKFTASFCIVSCSIEGSPRQLLIEWKLENRSPSAQRNGGNCVQVYTRQASER